MAASTRPSSRSWLGFSAAWSSKLPSDTITISTPRLEVSRVMAVATWSASVAVPGAPAVARAATERTASTVLRPPLSMASVAGSPVAPPQQSR